MYAAIQNKVYSKLEWPNLLGRHQRDKFSLAWFYGISTTVGYLILYIYIYMYI